MRNCERVTSVRGPLAVRRMTAHWVVLAAAAVTTLVAAAVGAALAAFAGQALPQAVRHDLVVAPGTSLVAAGSFASGKPAQTSAVLRSSIAAELGGVPFSFWQGIWSDPLGFVAGSMPAKPTSITSGNTPQLRAASLDGVADHAVLVTGKWPGQLSASAGGAAGGAIPAALPANTAALLKLRPGNVLRVQDQDTGAQLTFILTGLYAERQSPGSAASYWQLNSIPASGFARGSGSASGFTTYGPLVVPPSVFPGQLAEGTGTWVAQPDMADFNASDLSAISAHLRAIGDASSLLSTLTLTTNLPTVLADTGDNAAVARSLLGISALELLVLTVAALLAVARLLAAQREGETALLTARGATRWQLTRLTAAEVIPLSLVSALIGGIAGIWLARLLAGTLYRPGTAGGSVPNGGISVGASGTWLDALAAALGIAVLSGGALLYPVLRPGRAAAQVRRGRRAVLSGATRVGADLALVALAVLACWQLRRYSAVQESASGPSAIDPVLVLAPALALAGGTVLTLRLLPAASRAVDRVSAAGRGLTSALAGWEFSRQSLRQGGAALLLVMAVAAGTLALAQHQSWTRSAADQAAYVTGGDAQVNLAVPLPAGATTSIAGATGVRAAMAVSVNQATPAPVVAIDAAQAPKAALLRADQSSLPPATLLRSITPSSPSDGLLISGRPLSVQFTVTLSRAPLDSLTAQFTVTDATGAAFQFSSALFSADGRPHVLTASLGGTDAAYPLRLSQVILNYTLPAKRLKTPVTLTIAGATPRTWTAVASSPELVSELSTGNMYGPSAEPRVTGWQRAAGGATLTFTPGYGVWAATPGASLVLPEPVAGQVSLSALSTVPAAVPAIATRAFDSVNNTGVGSIVQTTINGITVPAKIVATASAFPTITGAGLVMDLSALEAFLVSHGTTPVVVTQWWLATADGQAPASLTRALPPGATITSSAALTAATVADPLSAAPQQALLAMTLAAALLAISGFWVSIAANVRQRRAENALLAALGVNQRSAAAQLFLEKLLLSVPAAALGLLLGAVVAWLLVPAVTLSPTAQIPVPPPITMFDLPQAIPLAVAVAVLPALAAALVVFRRPDPAAELRAAEAA
jgi:hypothetical protein